MEPLQKALSVALPSEKPKPIKDIFEEIIAKVGQEEGCKSCWNIVREMKNGSETLAAAKVFYEIFPENEFTFSFEEGDIVVSGSVIEALKKDSVIIKNLIEDSGGDEISFNLIGREQLLTVLNRLYPNEGFEKGDSQIRELILAANYLDVKSVLQSEMRVYEQEAESFKTKNELSDALNFYKAIQVLPDDLQEPLIQKLAPYFGKMLSNADPVKRKELIEQYREYKISALSFEKSNDAVSFLSNDAVSFLKDLAAIDTLRHLNLSEVKTLIDAHIELLPRNLKTLNFSKCDKITDEGLSKLPMGLTYLNLAFCNKITDEGLGKLPPELTILSLQWCKKITNEGLGKLPPGITRLNLAVCNKITDKGLSNLPPGTTSLDLEGCEKITDEGLGKLPKGLTSLILAGCDEITDEGLGQLPKGITSLKLTLCDKITNDGLGRLPPGITSLNLRGCNKITDEGLGKLPPGITSLDLERCYKITDEGLGRLPKGIKSLNLRGCNKITDKGLATLPPGITVQK